MPIARIFTGATGQRQTRCLIQHVSPVHRQDVGPSTKTCAGISQDDRATHMIPPRRALQCALTSHCCLVVGLLQRQAPMRQVWEMILTPGSLTHPRHPAGEASADTLATPPTPQLPQSLAGEHPERLPLIQMTHPKPPAGDSCRDSRVRKRAAVSVCQGLELYAVHESPARGFIGPVAYLACPALRTPSICVQRFA